MRNIGKIGLAIILISLTSSLGISIFIGFDLDVKHNDLTKDYNELLGDYADLTNNYTDLMNNYTDLANNYESLFTNYNALKLAFEEPLTNPDVPTYFEFQNWLDSMTWRVRIAVMEYSLVADPNYNVKTHEGAYAHAFCFILCSDNYIYYVEPQTDSVWYWTTVEYHFEIWAEYNFTGISDTVWGENWLWVNYYNYFG